MMKKIRNPLALLLALCLALSLPVPALAADTQLQSDVAASAAYMVKTVSDPQVGSIGGEWAVLGLARSGCSVPDSYYRNYYAAVETYVKACKGVLHEKKYTEYARVTVALAAIGKDPADVAGYNLLTPLGDFDKTVWQGINGPVWALIALDAGGYAMPVCKTAAKQATRQMYVDEILSRQLDDGGWNLTDRGGSGSADADITGMALQALAKYQDRSAVKTATDKALSCLSGMQNADGGFSSGGTANSESCAQVIVALCELGLKPDDRRFVKNGHTMLENLLTFRCADGSFRHTADGSGNSQMSSEQGLYALVSALRAETGRPSLYRMTDALHISGSAAAGSGLAGKDAAVQAVPVTVPGKTFDDIVNSENRAAIEALAARGIVNGKTGASFDPDAAMTRAEFTAIVVRALGLTPKRVSRFADVKSTDWCAGYVGTAYACGIVNGTSDTAFTPGGTITRQEAAAMTARAARLCGMDTAYTTAAARDVLAQFSDYVKCAGWAIPGLAFCCDKGITDTGALTIRPQQAVRRGEVAQMIFRLLSAANLL